MPPWHNLMIWDTICYIRLSPSDGELAHNGQRDGIGRLNILVLRSYADIKRYGIAEHVDVQVSDIAA